MTTLVFGNFPADMTEPGYFGYGRFFPSPDIELLSFSATEFTARDPATGSTMTAFGSFDVSSEEAFLNSRVTGVVQRTSSGALLLEWQGISLTVQQVAESSNDEAVNALILGGQDVISGGNGADILRGYAGNDLLNGNGGNDALRGDQGNDTLDGGLGNDTMVGGAGNDTYFRNATGDVVTEGLSAGIDTVQSSVTYTLSANVEKLTLTGTGVINGTGNTLNNTLTGNAKNNTLNGGAGNDTMIGGAGNDTYFRNATGDAVTELANAGIDTVQSSVGYTLGANLERLTLTGAGHINGTGNTLNNTLAGNTGNNVLDGGTGNDTMSGGAGNDTYVRNATGDVVTEGLNAGIDTVQSSVTYTLSANVEKLTLTGVGNINGTGNGLANTITGNSGNNNLQGLAGNDTLSAGNGNDTLFGGAGVDQLLGAGGNDRLSWDAADTLVNGNAGVDTLEVNGTTALDLTAVSNTKIQGIEIIDLAGNNRLTLALADVLAISSTTDTLRVDGNAGDRINAGGGWTQGADRVIGADLYESYTQGAATLLVDADVTWILI